MGNNPIEEKKDSAKEKQLTLQKQARKHEQRLAAMEEKLALLGS